MISGSRSFAASSSGLQETSSRRPAPDFTLNDAHGSEIKLSDYRGKVVLLNFWATWCGPCKAEIPWFVEFESKYRNSGLVVLGVSMDDDGWKSVLPYLARMKVNYRMVLGRDTVSAKYGGVESLPQTVLIDREGRVALTHVGLTSKSNYEAEILQLLSK